MEQALREMKCEHPKAVHTSWRLTSCSDCCQRLWQELLYTARSSIEVAKYQTEVEVNHVSSTTREPRGLYPPSAHRRTQPRTMNDEDAKVEPHHLYRPRLQGLACQESVGVMKTSSCTRFELKLYSSTTLGTEGDLGRDELILVNRLYPRLPRFLVLEPWALRSCDRL